MQYNLINKGLIEEDLKEFIKLTTPENITGRTAKFNAFKNFLQYDKLKRESEELL